MQHTLNAFMRSPGGENEGGSTDPKDEETKDGDLQPGTEATEEKGFGEKVKEALQDWSNDDQRQQDIDDATP